jgi:enhancing lycopene biosynthesis protein 2
MDDIIDAEREQLQDDESHLAVIERLGGGWLACPHDDVEVIDDSGMVGVTSDEWLASDTLIDAREVA